ncbi:alkaline ceramidase 3 [Biomphalaria glabrata]|nr:alkaline ceramidase 3 [Biomphalaria glabrata]
MPPLADGFWGKETSTLDWCEENYVVSYYVAEFWNTVSNVIMIFAPFVMVFVGYTEKHEKRFLYSFLALTVVGTGSWFFHMTLKYSMQLMDELPMIWGTSFLVYSLYMMDSKPNEECLPLRNGLIIYSIVVTLVYILVKDPIFHQVAYGLMVASIIIMASRILLTIKCSRKLYLTSLFTYGLGFFLWNVDNVFCSHLRAMDYYIDGLRAMDYYIDGLRAMDYYNDGLRAMDYHIDGLRAMDYYIDDLRAMY